MLPLYAEEHAAFPPGEFKPIPQKPGNYLKNKVNPRHSACERGLHNSMEAFQVSKYQMGKLLGIRDPSNFNKYFSGRSRPSALHWARLVQLWSMFNAGVVLFKVRSINWDNSEVTWRNGDVTRENHLLGGRGSVSKEAGQSNRESSELPHQWGGQAKPRPTRRTDLPRDEGHTKSGELPRPGNNGPTS